MGTCHLSPAYGYNGAKTFPFKKNEDDITLNVSLKTLSSFAIFLFFSALPFLALKIALEDELDQEMRCT